MAVARHPAAGLLSDLPDWLLASLLANAKPVNLAAGKILFLAGDPGDGCYRVNEGLLKVSIASHTGAERILAILGSRFDRRRYGDDRWAAKVSFGIGITRLQDELFEPRRV